MEFISVILIQRTREQSSKEKISQCCPVGMEVLLIFAFAVFPTRLSLRITSLSYFTEILR